MLGTRDKGQSDKDINTVKRDRGNLFFCVFFMGKIEAGELQCTCEV